MKRIMKPLVLAATLPLLLLADFSPEAPLGLTLAREAAAIVGAPRTPGSVAGVARRTTRRTVAVTSYSAAAASSSQQQATAQQQSATAAQQSATAAQQAGAPPLGSTVAALPAGCVSSPKGGVEYFNCAGVYYRPAFQSNNLVYVVVQQP